MNISLQTLKQLSQHGYSEDFVNATSKVLVEGSLNTQEALTVAQICLTLSEYTLARKALELYTLPKTAKLSQVLGYYTLWLELDMYAFVEKKLGDLCVQIQHPAILHMHGTVLMQMGKLEQAKTQLINAYQLEPRGETFLSIVALLDKAESNNFAIPSLPMANANSISEACFHAAVSQLYQRQENFEKAILHAQFSNAATTFDSAKSAVRNNEVLNKTQEQLQRASTRELTDQSIAPVFIISMPRSGSTLLEGLISKHSQIHGLGESNLMAKLVESSLTAQQSVSIAARFSRYTEQKFGANQIVVDKSLTNIYYLPHILECFPEAKILFLKRNYEPMAWSCFQTHFSQGLTWTSHFNAIKKQHNFFHSMLDLMKDSDRPFLEITYETLVADSASTMQTIFDYLGLATENVFEQNTPNRIVKTASVMQVRNEINSSSLSLPSELHDFVVKQS